MGTVALGGCRKDCGGRGVELGGAGAEGVDLDLGAGLGPKPGGRGHLEAEQDEGEAGAEADEALVQTRPAGAVEGALVGREQVEGGAVAGWRVWFESNIDNYGEISIDGELDRRTGAVAGINMQQRVEVSARAVPGARHVIACLAVNGPLAQPGGNIFIRYATLAFES